MCIYIYIYMITYMCIKLYNIQFTNMNISHMLFFYMYDYLNIPAIPRSIPILAGATFRVPISSPTAP